MAAREKTKDTTIWCRVRFDFEKDPERAPARLKEDKINLRAGSLNLDGDLKWASKYSPAVQDKIQTLITLGNKIRESSLPVSCDRDSECRVQGLGDKGCGGFVSSVYYSGNPPIIGDILTFNKLDDELNGIIQNLSTCDYHMLFVPKCEQNVCGPGTTPLK
jgi:hypothetical protein